MNPPYGAPLRSWLEKIAHEARKGFPILALLPASRFEQGYFQTDVVGQANVACMVRKRLAFLRPSTGEVAKGNPYASILWGYNVEPKRFAACFKTLGMCVTLQKI